MAYARDPGDVTGFASSKGAKTAGIVDIYPNALRSLRPGTRSPGTSPGTPSKSTPPARWADSLRPQGPRVPDYMQAYISPGQVAAFTAQLANARLALESQLAAYQGQEKNVRAQFRSDRASIAQQTAAEITRAEGEAVERGVLGGGADIKQRVGIEAQSAAMLESARIEKQQALADLFQQSISAQNEYNLAIAQIDSAKQTAISEAVRDAYLNDFYDAGERLRAKDINRNGDFGSIVEQIGMTQLGVKYVFGAKDAGDEFDCSGFTSWVYQQATGKVLPHNAEQQRTMPGMKSVEPNKLQAGDLVFFWFPNERGIPPGQASHVGIYLGNGIMLDASSANGGIVRRGVFWDSIIGGGRLPDSWGLLDRWSQDVEG